MKASSERSKKAFEEYNRRKARYYTQRAKFNDQLSNSRQEIDRTLNTNKSLKNTSASQIKIPDSRNKNSALPKDRVPLTPKDKHKQEIEKKLDQQKKRETLAELSKSKQEMNSSKKAPQITKYTINDLQGRWVSGTREIIQVVKLNKNASIIKSEDRDNFVKMWENAYEKKHGVKKNLVFAKPDKWRQIRQINDNTFRATGRTLKYDLSEKPTITVWDKDVTITFIDYNKIEIKGEKVYSFTMKRQ